MGPDVSNKYEFSQTMAKIWGGGSIFVKEHDHVCERACYDK